MNGRRTSLCLFPFGKKRQPIASIRLTLLANRAAPSPILGQALGQYGINILNFCKKFNEQTKNINSTVYVPATITIYDQHGAENNFEVKVKTPTITYLFKRTATSGGSFILLKEIYQIAIFKKCDPWMNHLNLKAICKTLIGTVKSMGIKVRSSY